MKRPQEEVEESGAGTTVSKISIVTPCLNAERYIGETVSSVLEQSAVQSGRVELEYLICDGGSTDRTLEIVRAFGSPRIGISSEPDRGMYDALARGLQRVTGDWVAYLNAGDLYSPYAFDLLLDVLRDNDPKWVTGMIVRLNEQGYMVDAIAPLRYRRSLIRAGQYSRRFPFYLPWIQQEAVFWQRSLLGLVDMERLAQLKLAGDAYLWRCFAREHDLEIICGHLGGWRCHPGQLSENRREYVRELNEISRRSRLRDLPLALMDSVLWYAPQRLKKRLNPMGMYCHDQSSGRWR